MPTTPKLVLPYPAPTDPADVPTDMGELASRIDTVAGAASGLATLDAAGKVPAAQLPPAGAAIPPSIVDAKGDLIVGSADDTVARLGIGAAVDGYVLTKDAAQALGMKWAAAGGGGGASVLGYAEFTAPVSAGGAEGAPTTVVALPSIVFDGVTPVMIEFWSPGQVVGVSQTAGFSLWDMTANVDLGRLSETVTDANSRPTPNLGDCFGRRRLTPVAGARIYAVRAWRSASTYQLLAGLGGAGLRMPGYVRCVRDA